MVVISYKLIREFTVHYPDSANALNTWFKASEKANWSNFHQLKEDFNSVDAVGNDRYVFNIKGNNYRLIALINFSIRTIYLLFIGTHGEYDKIDASTIKLRKK
ncbi:type II toxin-antitoxin system HigB family toxin [Dyadobacter sp. CY343]|uniref:type II toxin-antitoxin system HigB family toxin n=1 Tax=Dyadobacter sp. CY343 TaxID=2907299 RepID=UPI001F17B97D|nr:type II toxin-antitoxin system HigB family toxin [Dyadobacter sp. CY343]MCE7063467.1 type II toxin-antitoxin system HigB family toxin [Dyadobacter sp. CY343]